MLYRNKINNINNRFNKRKYPGRIVKVDYFLLSKVNKLLVRYVDFPPQVGYVNR